MKKRNVFLFYTLFIIVFSLNASTVFSNAATLIWDAQTKSYHCVDCRGAQKINPGNLDNYILEFRGSGSDGIPGINDVKNRQISVNVLRSFFDIQRVVKTNGRIGLAIEPFVGYRYIEESRHSDSILNRVKIGTAWQPKDDSIECGLNLIIRF
jgi:hypothetical protein